MTSVSQKRPKIGFLEFSKKLSHEVFVQIVLK